MEKEKIYALYNKETKEYLKGEWPYDKDPALNYNKEYFNDKIKDGWEVIEWIPRKPFYSVTEEPACYSINGNGSVNNEFFELYEFTNKEQDKPVQVFKKFLLSRLYSGMLEFSIYERTEEGYYNKYVTVKDGKDKLGQPCWIVTIYTRQKDCDGVTESEDIYISKGGKNKDPELATQEYIDKYGLDQNIDVLRSGFIIEQYNSPIKLIEQSQRDLEAERAGY